MMRIGLLSDTHGYLDRQVFEFFSGVNHILHAGDIGLPSLIQELESIAPVTAVLGNTDAGLDFKETEILELYRRKFLVHHDLSPASPAAIIRRRIMQEAPDVVVFGHTHKPHCETIGRTLYLNPGYAGKPRWNQPRSVAIVRCDAGGIASEFKSLR
jgi:putative phosphoesterase